MNTGECTTHDELAPTPAPDENMRALAEAFEEFTRTTRAMEESYRLLEGRIRELDRELAEKNRELALTSDYLNSILESMSDGVVAVDIDGVVTAFNHAANHVLGFEAHEVVGRSFRQVFNREFAAPPGRQVMEWRARDGRLVTVSERDSPMSDREGRRIGTVKVFQDLTEIRELRTKIRRKDRLAALGEMAATVAHEIRNPLGGISGFAALLARELRHDEPRARLVDKIILGAKDLERLVNGLLEYTRPIQLRLRLTNCADLVDAAIGFIELDGRPIQIINAVDPDIQIMADPDRLRQVFLNILLNAVESIEESGQIRVSDHIEDDAIVVAFADTGCGMTPEQLERVFSPFFTTKEKGTGLGLAIAAQIVEVHGGRLDAASERGKGSTFFVRLPRTG